MPHNNTNAPAPRPEVLTRPKLEGGRRFAMHTGYSAAGDQPAAIREISEGGGGQPKRGGIPLGLQYQQDGHCATDQVE